MSYEGCIDLRESIKGLKLMIEDTDNEVMKDRYQKEIDRIEQYLKENDPIVKIG